MKIKHIFILLPLLLLSFGLTACKSTAGQPTSSQAAGELPGAGDLVNASLSDVEQLAIGTLKLESGGQAITAEQAAQLLTLWQAYQALGNSDTAAQAEIEAIVRQIKDTMTGEQMDAITAMALTRQTMFEEMQALGIDFGNRSSNPGGTPQAGQASPGRGQNGGGFPEGGPGGGMPGGGPGGSMPGGGEMSGPGGFGGQTTPDATVQARFANQASRVNPMLLQALIEMLESKVP
ncbi:MAG: hypothetical protein ACOYYS_02915 [Chloroflexota bacterium]